MGATLESLKREKLADGLRLAPQQDLVASTVEALRAAFAKSLKGATGTLVLDLAQVEQTDSMGITLVLGLFKSCQAKGLGFRIQGANADIQRVFKLFNLTKFFEVAG